MLFMDFAAFDIVMWHRGWLLQEAGAEEDTSLILNAQCQRAARVIQAYGSEWGTGLCLRHLRGLHMQFAGRCEARPLSDGATTEFCGAGTQCARHARPR